MIMVLGPHKKKADAKAEREAEKAAARTAPGDDLAEAPIGE